MKIVFMGTPEISVPTLERLIEDSHEVACVVTQPDRPRGRGKKITVSPVKEVALKNNLRVLQPEKVSDKSFEEEIRKINPDVIVVIAFGQILKKNILDIPKYGCINIHVSLLPKYRGAAPINWVLINGEKKTGITTMFMEEGLDTGDIIESVEFDLDDEINAGELHDWMKKEGANLISSTLKKIEDNSFTRTKQDDSMSSYAPMMDKNLGHIDFSKSAKEVHNLVRGTLPWPGAFCETPLGKLKIYKTRVLDKVSKGEAGVIEAVSKLGIEVNCSDKMILIEEIQMPNKKRMKVSEYIKGNTIDVGSVLK